MSIDSAASTATLLIKHVPPPAPKILSAVMENPVTKLMRTCSDAALTQCDEARPTPLLRRIELSLVPDQPR